ncbi:MAG: TOMM precursor leader peptide-binding protein [Gemmatimonadaceae bacterium]
MLLRPAFDPRWRVTLVPGEGVFFSRERDYAVFEGRAVERVAALINGRRASEAIVDSLAKQHSLAEIYYVLFELERQGCIREAATRSPAGGVPKVESFKALVEGGRVVLVDDYLDPKLDGHNRAALRNGWPWMIAKVVGAEIWIGPVFVPGQTACWTCLAHRLRLTRAVDAFLETRSEALVLSRPAPSNAEAVRHAIEVVARMGSAQPGGSITAIDAARGTWRRYSVTRRPQCPVCGDPAMYARQLERLDVDQVCAGNGLWRGRSRLVNPVGGITASIARISSADSKLLHVYASAPTMPPLTGSTWNVAALRTVLQIRSCGSGITRSRAIRSALAEVVERYCGAAHGDEPVTRAALAKLGARGIHPNTCMLYSNAQLRARRAWSADGDFTSMVPEPFDPKAFVDWTPVWSLTSGEQRLLPTAFVYREARGRQGRTMCIADSNGNAAGTTLADAIVRGFLELVERDSIALWWYNRLPRPTVDLRSLRDPYFGALTHTYRSMGRDYWVLDITGDLGVPTFAAVTCRSDSKGQIVKGFGAHLDSRRAILHAVNEMSQLVASLSTVSGSTEALPAGFARWVRDATVEKHPFLASSGVPIPLREDSASQGLGYCRSLVAKAGLELLVLDQTRPDIGVPVVKVIIPGLRPAAARFAPGRLFDVPVRMGWLDRPKVERELNPVPFFL